MTTQTFLWPLVDQIPPLPLEYVHVYAWDLDVAPLPQDWKTLSEDETHRARRFVFPRDRDRYVRAHSAMRAVLASYSGMLPAEVSFSANAYGKPQIQQATNAERLQFNLSHSAGIAVLAVARGYELGVDLEMVRPIDQDVAEHHFSPHELLTLRSLPAYDWLPGFFRCWTSKEALLKGEGLGLNLPLDAFDVEVHPQRAPALLASRLPARIATGWRLVPLNPAQHAVGTLAVLDATRKFTADAVQCFSLNG
jgi:4'-phosphopantetheinyl transferase